MRDIENDMCPLYHLSWYHLCVRLLLSNTWGPIVGVCGRLSSIA